MNLYRVFGGNSEEIEDLIIELSNFVANRRSPIMSSDARRQIEAVFETIDPRHPIPQQKVNEISEIVKNFSTWKYIKSNGENFFTGGSPYNNFNKICNLAENVGIIINRHGELENLCKTIAPRKSEWLAAVLLKDLLNDEALDSARTFTCDLVKICRKVVA